MKKHKDIAKTRKILTLLTHPVVSGSAVLVVGNMAANVVNLVYQVLMGKVLNPEGYGILLSLYSVLYILSIVPLSSSVSIVKFISSAKDVKERTKAYLAIKRFIWWTAIILSLAVVVLSVPLARFLKISDIVSVLLTAPVLFFSLITLVNQASCQGILKFMGVVLPNFTMSAVKLVVGLALVFLGFYVRGVMLGVVIGGIAAYILSLYYIRGRFDEKVNGRYDLKSFFVYSAPVLIQALAFTSFFTVDVILVKHFFPAVDAGIYGAVSTIGKIIFFAASPVASAMFPIVSGRKARGEKYFEVLIGSLLLTLVISAGAAFVYYLFPGLILQTLYRKEYLVAQSELVWMGIFIAFYTMSSFLVNFFLSIDKTKVVVIPLVFAILQIVGIWFFHGSLLQVIQISLGVCFLMFLILLGILGYNRYEHEKK